MGGLKNVRKGRRVVGWDGRRRHLRECFAATRPECRSCFIFHIFLSATGFLVRLLPLVPPPLARRNLALTPLRASPPIFYQIFLLYPGGHTLRPPSSAPAPHNPSTHEVILNSPAASHLFICSAPNSSTHSLPLPLAETPDLPWQTKAARNPGSSAARSPSHEQQEKFSSSPAEKDQTIGFCPKEVGNRRMACWRPQPREKPSKKPAFVALLPASSPPSPPHHRRTTSTSSTCRGSTRTGSRARSAPASGSTMPRPSAACRGSRSWRRV